MAKKAAPKSSPVSKSPAVAPVTDAPIAETAVRKTVAPKVAPLAAVAKAASKKAPAPITYERIAERAYFISQSGYGGSEDDNWLRAEAELKSEI